MKKFIQYTMVLMLYFSILSIIYGNSKGLVVYTKGECYLIRNNSQSSLKVNTIILEQDIIKTKKNSNVNIQLSNGVLIRIGEESQITLKKILNQNRDEEFELQLNNGNILSKVEKEKNKNKNIKLNIQSPTAIASVRGTEFYVETSTTIAVNQGKVEVSSIDGTQKQTVEAGEKIMATFQELKKSILETYEKEKFKMIQELDKTKKQNLENVIKQIENNQKLIEEQKNKIQFPDNPFQK